jgi:hypothetical protein
MSGFGIILSMYLKGCAFNVQLAATIENWLYRQTLYLKYLGYRLLRSLSFSLFTIFVIVVTALASRAYVPISAV